MLYSRSKAAVFERIKPFAQFFFKAGPSEREIDISLYTSMPVSDGQDPTKVDLMTKTAQDIHDAFIRRSCITIPLDRNIIPEEQLNRFGRDDIVDGKVKANVIVQHKGFYLSIHIALGSDYEGNGVVLTASYNQVTVVDRDSANDRLMAKANAVPAQVGDMYAKFKGLEQQGLTQVALR